MTESPAHLAQVNVGLLAAAVDDPQLAEFMDNLDAINALAERSPGFVWRLVGSGNNATDLRPFPDPSVLVNMSVWTSIDALKEYVFKTDHASFLRRRREWFLPYPKTVTALWHVPVGHIPTPGEAWARLNHIDRYGHSDLAFGFRHHPSNIVTVHRTELSDPTAQELIVELKADISARYPERDSARYFSLAIDEVAAGTGGFFVVRKDGELAGCGAIRQLNESGEAEIKRMYVRKAFRGQQLGSAILSHLTGVAHDLGANQLRLETSVGQPEAIKLYERNGFTRTENFGQTENSAQYRGESASLCFAKLLS